MDAVDKRIPVSSSVQLATIPTMDSLLVQKATEKPGKGCFEVFNFVLKFRATKAFERGVCPFQFLIHCGRVSCGPPNKRAINRALWHLEICLMKLMVQLFTPGVAANSPPITFSLKQNGKVSSRPPCNDGCSFHCCFAFLHRVLSNGPLAMMVANALLCGRFGGFVATEKLSRLISFESSSYRWQSQHFITQELCSLWQLK